MAEPRDDGILQEIDEELRHERYAKLWQRYGNVVIGAAVLLVVGVAGYQGWRHYDVTTRQALGEKFTIAMQAETAGKLDDAAKQFATLAAEGRAGYAVLARLQEASLAGRKGDRAKAASLYKSIAADNGVDAIYRDLAVVLGAMNEIDTAAPEELKTRLMPQTVDTKPWRFTARELVALLAQKAGQKEEAAKLFKALAEDTAAPQGVRARAGDMAAVLGNG